MQSSTWKYPEGWRVMIRKHFFSPGHTWCSTLPTFVIFFFGGGLTEACSILVPRSAIEPMPLAGKAWSPTYWAAREFPVISFNPGGIISVLLLVQYFYLLVLVKVNLN